MSLSSAPSDAMHDRGPGFQQDGRTLRPVLLAALAAVAAGVLAAALLMCRGVQLTITKENAHALRRIAVVNNSIWEVKWSPDGRRVAFVRLEEPVEIRDARTLDLLERVGEGRKIIHFAFSSDPHVVAFCENGTQVEIQDTRTGSSMLIKTPNHQPAMTFSPDGKLLATGGYGTRAGVWYVGDGGLRWSLNTAANKVVAGGLTPVFSPDGKLLAVGNRNSETVLFDVATGEPVHRLPRPSTHGLAFSPDGTRLAISYVDGNVALWRVSDGTMVHLRKAGEEIYRVGWSPDGSLLLSAGLKADLVFWEPDDLSVIARIRVPEWVISATFRPDGRQILLAGGSENSSGERSLEVIGVRPLDWLLARLGGRDATPDREGKAS